MSELDTGWSESNFSLYLCAEDSDNPYFSVNFTAVSHVSSKEYI